MAEHGDSEPDFSLAFTPGRQFTPCNTPHGRPHWTSVGEEPSRWGQFLRNTTFCSILLAPTAKGIICWPLLLLKVLVATSSAQSNAPIARKSGSRHFRGQLWPGLFPSDFFLKNSV